MWRGRGLVDLVAVARGGVKPAWHASDRGQFRGEGVGADGDIPAAPAVLRQRAKLLDRAVKQTLEDLMAFGVTMQASRHGKPKPTPFGQEHQGRLIEAWIGQMRQPQYLYVDYMHDTSLITVSEIAHFGIFPAIELSRPTSGGVMTGVHQLRVDRHVTSCHCRGR